MDSLPHLPWIIVSEMSFYFPLVRLLGCFDASPQVCSGSAVLCSVPRPEGGVAVSDEEPDLTRHPGFLVWENPGAFFDSDISSTVRDVGEYSLCVLFQVLVLK